MIDMSNTNSLQVESYFIYSRINSKDTALVEEKLFKLYKYPLLAVCSGMAAYINIILANPGCIVIDIDSYCELKSLLNSINANYQVLDLNNVTNIPLDTSIIFADSISNPYQKKIDLKRLVSIKNNAKICIDNTMLSAYYYNPFKEGADIVIESLSKYYCGHNDALGGCIVFKKEADYIKSKELVTLSGTILQPIPAYLISRGIDTLSLRMDYITKSANFIYMKLNKYVTEIYYCGKAGVITFNKKDLDPDKFLSNLKLIKNEFSFGAINTMAIKKPGTNDIRLSIGLEDSNIILNDILQALNASGE